MACIIWSTTRSSGKITRTATSGEKCPDAPDWIKQQDPLQPGLGHQGTGGGLTPAPYWIIRGRARRSSHHLQDRIIRGNVDWRVQGKVAARSEGDIRLRLMWCSEGVMSGCCAMHYAMEMQSYSDEDEAEEMQCSIDEDEAVVKQRQSPENEAAVMQRCSHEDKAVVMQTSRDEEEAEVMQGHNDVDKAIVRQ